MIKTVLILLQTLFIIRFHLEISTVNAHTEPANTIRKITNPLVLPLKRLIPLAWAKKFAAIAVAFFVAVVILFVYAPQIGVVNILIQSLLWLVRSWLTFLQYGIFIYVLGSWLQFPVMQRVNYLMHALFEPVLKPIRQVVPTFGGIDISPMILLFGLSFGSNWFFSLFQ